MSMSFFLLEIIITIRTELTFHTQIYKYQFLKKYCCFIIYFRVGCVFFLSVYS